MRLFLLLGLLAVGACSGSSDSVTPDGTDVTDGDDGSGGDDGGGRGDDSGDDDDDAGSGDDDDDDDDDGGSGDDGSGGPGGDDDDDDDDGSGGPSGDDDDDDDDGGGPSGDDDDGGSGDDGSGGPGGDDDDDDDDDGPDDGGTVGDGGGLFDECEGHEHDPSTDKLFHSGALAEGTKSIVFEGSTYRLRFEGDETLEYQIDVEHESIQQGLVRVYEATSGSFPLSTAGPGFRTQGGQLRGPDFLTTRTELVDHGLTNNGFRIDYVDTVDGRTFTRRHEFALKGKSLRVRIRATDATLLEWAPNYAGIVTGPTDRTFHARPVYMQGTLAAPTLAFFNEGEPYFAASFLDLTRSHASDFDLPDPQEVTAQGTGIDLGYDTLGLYDPTSAGELAAPLDETLSIVVSQKLEDVFLIPSQPPSPFRSRLANRTVVQFSGDETSWSTYGDYLAGLYDWGVDNLAVYPFFWWTASQPEGIQNVGPDWHPAKDEANFEALVDQALAQGYLMGVYTLFMGMPITSPVYDHADVVKHASGEPKMGSFASSQPFELASDSAVLDDVRREANLLKGDYGLNMAFVDVSTYWAPSRGASGSQIDEEENSGLAQTLEDAIVARKRWLAQLKETMQGPLLGEGSIGTHDSNTEWLWSGYCDSTQRVINTGYGKSSVDIPAGSPQAVTNWPVIPEYELRVAMPRQAHHGNGFFYRFFGPADGPLIFDVQQDELVYPLTDEGLDTYRIYELTYGHTSYFQTNGPPIGFGDYVHRTSALKEYYMVNALQEQYLESRVDSIHYEIDGVLRTFEEAFIAAGTLDAFVDPRIRLVFANGFTMYLNHGEDPWVVELATPVHGDTIFVLPEDGFLARLPGTELFAFSGWTPDNPGQRFDYANKPGQYEFFDGRRSVDGYGNIYTGLWEGGTVPTRRIAFINHVRALSMLQTESGEFVQEVGEAPELVAVQVEAAKTKLAPEESLAVRAVARFDNGATRDVSSLVTWTTSDDTVLHVSPGGAVVGCRKGSATVSASSYQGVAATGWTFEVTDD